jgi:hypothetical protein
VGEIGVGVFVVGEMEEGEIGRRGTDLIHPRGKPVGV